MARRRKPFVPGTDGKSAGAGEPLLARPHPTQDGKYDLRAGARRLAAAKLAGLAFVPVMVREMTDQEALEITVVENLQRQDLDPMEESAGVKLLLERGWEVRAIAAHLGRSPEWVVRRSRLVNLSEKWRARIVREFSELTSWGAGHLELIARLEPEAQDRLIDEDDNGGGGGFDDSTTIDELEGLIRETMRELKKAPWDIYETPAPRSAKEMEKKWAPMTSCAACPRRTNAVPGLFDAVDASSKPEDGRCMDRRCWDAKLTTWTKMRVEVGTEPAPVLVRKDWHSEAPPALKRLAVSERDVEVCKEKTPGAKKMMRVEGPEAGKVFYGKMRPQESQGGGRHVAGEKKDDSPAAKLRDAKEMLRRRRWKHALDAAEKAAMKKTVKDLVLPKGADRDLFILAFEAAPWCSKMKKTIDWALKVKKVAEIARIKEKNIVEDMFRGPFIYYSIEHSTPELENARTCAELFGIDLDKLYAEAEKAVPQPKELAELVEKVKAAKAEKKGAGVKEEGEKVKEKARKLKGKK